MTIANTPGWFQDWCRRAGRDGAAWFNALEGGTFTRIPEFYRQLLIEAGKDSLNWLNPAGASGEFAKLPQYAQDILRTAGLSGDKFVESAPLLLPTDVPGLVTWIDASNAAQRITGSGKVSQLTDQSPTAKHFVNGIFATQPTLEAAYQNGKDVARFQTANATVLQSAANPALDGWSAISMFCAMKYPGAGTLLSEYLATIVNDVSHKGAQIWTYSLPTPQMSSYITRNLAAGNVTTQFFNSIDNSFAIWELHCTVAGAVETVFDGVVKNTGVASSVGAQAHLASAIGAFADGVVGQVFADLYFGEMAIFANVDLTPTQKTGLRAYLKPKWGTA